MSVVCFSLVVMAWYGVNFVLGAGLHSYGFGDGGQGFVYSAIFFQWLYAGIAIHRSRADAILADSLPDHSLCPFLALCLPTACFPILRAAECCYYKSELAAKSSQALPSFRTYVPRLIAFFAAKLIDLGEMRCSNHSVNA